MRIYLDCCCYSRPFDDLSNSRVRLEAEAVLAILSRVEANEVELITSDALELELSFTPDEQKRQGAASFLALSDEKVPLTEPLIAEAESLEQQGFGAFDALHLASARTGRADFLLTVDERLRRRASRVLTAFGPKFISPVEFVLGIEGDES